jgi:glutamate synthase (NADPH/NADH) large chain/glutamate synthase (ferredoxin)
VRAGIILESGEPREVHHFATLIGYGATAVNPYLLYESLDELVQSGEVTHAGEQAIQNLIGALGKGLLKTISKMGISTIQSYCGAQIFEAVGLERALIEQHFTGTASRIGGIGMHVLAQEALERHRHAYPAPHQDLLGVGGVYAWRRDGEHHMWNPDTIALLQQAVRAEDGSASEKYREYARAVNDHGARRATLRGLIKIVPQTPIPIEEVEPAQEIVKHFCTGAMSLGSLSREAHETLAIAMNRIGGRSNTGEGGEDPARYLPDSNGDNRRSAIKQVAAARFGVTTHYLVNADELQIKMAQGAKPGEGGQLPGHKVDEYIAAIRHTTPGVGLISPPPHHDIYSIEDLKQLIYDLRCVNPSAQVSVKLVSEVGVGTVAAGVAKANADRVVISGHDGGTGASPLSSVQSAGVPWEIGLAETQQTLLLNNLRSRILVQTDGQLKTGRDVVIAALLGADEMGFATAPLIATGCVMMRACHLNTCPVGIATQDPELRKRFAGTPEHVINFFFFVAEEVREILASLGLRSLTEAIGRVDLLQADDAVVDLSQILTNVELAPGAPRHRVESPPEVLGDALDWELVAQSRTESASNGAEPLELRHKTQLPIRNRNRCVGGILSGHIVRLHGAEGLPEDSVVVDFEGSAGQSFGGWLAHGVTFTLHGDAQDYVGKGLSGGVLAVRPRQDMGEHFKAEENVIVGNTVLYGATSGRAFFRGLAGERFAVRNSGAWAVVEGVGDHACEYMTGGRVVVLGPTGRNFAAGMSGGVAYVLDENGTFAARCNMGMVGFEDLTGADTLELRLMLDEHLQRTDSPVAARVLMNLEALLARNTFVKVMPHDYKRVLAKQEEERTEVPA